MRKVRIAQIGTGHDHASFTFISLKKQKDIFELVGIAETNPERADALNNPPYCDVPQYTIEQLIKIPDLDAVAVESDEELATQIAQRFIDRGVAVHLDKPGSPDISAFERLVTTAKARNLVLHMGYMYRYNPIIKKSINMVKAGMLGDIFAIEAHMSVNHSIEKRLWLGKYPGGMMYFLGCHLIDLVFLFQGEPEKIVPFNVSTGIDGVQSTDYALAVLEYPHGRSFIRASSVECNGFDRRQLVICGSKGTIEIRPLEEKSPDPTAPDSLLRSRAKVTLADRIGHNDKDQSQIWESDYYDRYDAMMKEFASIVLGENNNPYSYDYELKLFRSIMYCCGINTRGN